MSKHEMSKTEQLELFPTHILPEGFVYRPHFITPAQEQELVEHIRQIEFGEVKMHGVIARRHTKHYGLSYEYSSRQVQPGELMPDFILTLREQLRTLTDIAPDKFVEVLISEYPTGAGIGWHRDAPIFEVIAGVSLLSECRIRFRPQPTPPGPADPIPPKPFKPLVQLVEPRSAYLLQGASRWRWQHNIPTTEQLRYSITFRTLRAR
jgi:DNA oxidative demethylase